MAELLQERNLETCKVPAGETNFLANAGRVGHSELYEWHFRCRVEHSELYEWHSRCRVEHS